MAKRARNTLRLILLASDAGYDATGGFCSWIAFHPAESVKLLLPALNWGEEYMGEGGRR